MTIVKTEDIELNTDYRVSLTFKYDHSESTEMLLPQILYYFHQLRIHDVTIGRAQITLLLDTDTGLECELFYPSGKQRTHLVTDTCQIGEFSGIKSVAIVYSVRGREHVTDEWRIPEVRISSIKSPKLYVLGASEETQVKVVFEELLDPKVCDDFWISFGERIMAAKAECESSRATLRFNITSTFYL